MKVLIPTIGSLGDVQPFIALAQEAAAIRQRSGNMLAALFRVMNLAFNILAQAQEGFWPPAATPTWW